MLLVIMTASIFLTDKLDPTMAENHHHWPDGAGMIYMGMSPWDGMWKNRHQLMSRFAHQMPVLYVEPPLALRKFRRSVLSGRFPWNEFRSPDERRVDSNLYVYGSSALYPVSGTGLLRRTTEKRWHRAILRAASKVGIHRPILWISLPEQRRALRNMNPDFSIYHVVDEYAGYTAQNDRRVKKLAAEERIVLDCVDLTVAVSPELVRAKSGMNRDVRLVENAVDLRQFKLAIERNKTPADLAKIPAPRIGYSGLVGKRLNLSMILEIAGRHPEWSFIFVGKVDPRDCEADIMALQSSENVYFLGERKPEVIADYVAGFDIGLLPYELNVETTHISPLKMYEYLAVGLPVIATAIPAALRHGDLLEVANNLDEFDDKIREALVDNHERDMNKRMQFAEKNTWEDRVIELTGIITRALRKKDRTAKFRD